MFDVNSSQDPRRYNPPSSDEIAAIYITGDGLVPLRQGLTNYARDDKLQILQVTEPRNYSMIYPLPFPNGQLVRNFIQQKEQLKQQKNNLTMLGYYSSLLFEREGEYNQYFMEENYFTNSQQMYTQKWNKVDQIIQDLIKKN
ncbi:MAG: hypothetical protein EZS28_022208 [Streblomastix strix]|uniref:Uncharacterized protein n=1 Tax=Streblomastix strix TaxID=222440 RepID=A0A5J4VIB3_9EUKA|nr:MAG: hypothetical protein EZS28_022208 [Streblomastix strix]